MPWRTREAYLPPRGAPGRVRASTRGTRGQAWARRNARRRRSGEQVQLGEDDPAHRLRTTVGERRHPTCATRARPAHLAFKGGLDQSWVEPESECSIGGGHALRERAGPGQVHHGPGQHRHRPAVHHVDLGRVQRTGVTPHDRPAPAAAPPLTRDVDRVQRLAPDGQVTHHAGGRMAEGGSGTELGHGRLDQQPMPLLGRLLPALGTHVGAAPDALEVAEPRESREVAVAEATSGRLGTEQDAFHAGQRTRRSHPGPEARRDLWTTRPLEPRPGDGRHTTRRTPPRQAHRAGCARRGQVRLAGLAGLAGPAEQCRHDQRAAEPST